MKYLEQLRGKISYKTVRALISVVLVVYLLVSVIGYFKTVRSLNSFTLTGNDLHNIEAGVDSGLFKLTDPFFVRKGYYKYTVTYTSEGASGSFIWPFAMVDYFNAVEQAVTNCQEGTYSNSDSMWVNADVHMTLWESYSGKGTVQVSSFTMRETDALASRKLFTSFMFCFAVCLIMFFCEYRRKHPENTNIGFVLSAFAATVVLCSFPAFFAGVVNGDDVGFHLTRIQGIVEGLKAGQFPVRINPAFYNGYGYADPEYYGNLLLYIPALLMIWGFRLSTAYNVFIVCINVLTVSIAYYSFRKISGDCYIGLAGAFLYAMAPYRISCIYYRFAVGEYSAMAFFPLIAYGIWRIYTADVKEKNYTFSFISVAIGLSGLIQTHLLSCEMAGGVILLTCIILIGKTLQPRRFIQLAASVIATVLINLWFLVPLLDSMINQRVRINLGTGVTGIQRSGLFFSQLFTVFPINSLITTSASDYTIYKGELPLILGMVFLIGLALFAGVYSFQGAEKKTKRFGLLAAGLGILTAWMTTIYFPWDRISNMHPLFEKLISSLQFVWRFLGVSTILMTLVAVIGLVLLKNKDSGSFRTAAIALCIVALITPVHMMENAIQSQSFYVLNDISDIGYDTASTVSGAEYTLLDSSWDVVTTIFEPRLYSDAKISSYRKNGTTIDFHVDDPGQEGYLFLPLFNYRGYNAKGDSSAINSSIISNGEYNVIRVNIPEGYTGQVRIYFKGFWYWRVAEILSLLSVVGLILFVRLWGREKPAVYRKKKKQKKTV